MLLKSSRMNNTGKKDVIVIAGPTASGKSTLAAALAEQINGVVVCADALQVYRALPLLTAQPQDPTPCPHKLYGILPYTAQSNVGWWLQEACQTLHDVHVQKQYPIVVGGTGLYIKALFEGLTTMPCIPTAHKQHIRAQLSKRPPGWLYQYIQQHDLKTAQRLHPHDYQRLLRAYEMMTYTKQRVSCEYGKNDTSLICNFNLIYIAIQASRLQLAPYIDQRLRSMIKRGLFDEVRAFSKIVQQHTQSLPVTKALGFEAFQSHICGQMTLEEAMIRTTNDTLKYAKRQRTWFRHQLPEAAYNFPGPVSQASCMAAHLRSVMKLHPLRN